MFALLTLAAVGFAQPTLKVENAWVRLVPGKVTGAFMVISNTGAKPLRVVGVQSPVAGMAQIHQTVAMANDVKGMRELTGGLLVPAGGKVELKPGGVHVMLMNLKQTLREGEKVRLVLRLEGGQQVAVQATVMAK